MWYVKLILTKEDWWFPYFFSEVYHNYFNLLDYSDNVLILRSCMWLVVLLLFWFGFFVYLFSGWLSGSHI